LLKFGELGEVREFRPGGDMRWRRWPRLAFRGRPVEYGPTRAEMLLVSALRVPLGLVDSTVTAAGGLVGNVGADVIRRRGVVLPMLVSQGGPDRCDVS